MRLVLGIATDMLSDGDERKFTDCDDVTGAIVATVFEVWVRSIPFDIDASVRTGQLSCGKFGNINTMDDGATGES